MSEGRTLPADATDLGYRPGAVWDELVTGEGTIRPQWRGVMGYLAQYDPSEFAELRAEAARLLRHNGVAYTIYDDPRASERPWPLDLIPLVIPMTEWRGIEAGVVQRARLLNAILADLYGAQTLVSSGLLPPSLVHDNPSFLRPCASIAPPNSTFLHLYAVDLARARDGRWWVLADRLQAPSGAGYALENRSVVGGVLGDCMAAAQVASIAPFFGAFGEHLAGIAPKADRPPRIVLLTPGIYNETYFEHVYLARRLNITLVEGADLTVRNRRVFLKTLAGLEPVDVVLRRLDDDFCDPLELRPESHLGVAGLVEAARAGTVVIANALGSGMLEAMAFKPFLPGLSEALLGEPLALPDVASWWCGGATERSHVEAHIAELVIKPAFPALNFEPVFGAELSGAERAALLERIAARPHDFVGQERVELSTVPDYAGDTLVPRPLVLRVFVAATSNGFAAMPGGLTRTAPSDGQLIVSMQRGGGCKDTWIIGAGNQTARGETGESATLLSLRSDGGDRPRSESLPSRAADGLFWAGRYAERLAGGARILRSLLLGITDAARLWTMQEIEPVLVVASALGLLPRIDATQGPISVPELVSLVRATAVDTGHPNGLPANAQRLVGAGRGVRDHMPQECWQALAAFGRVPPFIGNRAVPARLLLRLDEIIALGAAFWGTVDDTMERDAGWRFLDLGRKLERAINLVATLRAAIGMARGGNGAEDTRLAAALAAFGARRVRAGTADETPAGWLALASVTTDVNDPASLAFQLGAMAAHLEALPRGEDRPGNKAGNEAGVARAIELVNSARAVVAAQLQPPTGEATGGEIALAAELGALASLDTLLPEISNALTRAYFTHAFARPA